ncbi:unnamed protein product [Allacma fusca]|uniref:C2H2-type domain-containing protein n=1 Tax=Allacma fusca TaxID=39272 RepID=A0A8J2MES3_9HEXA|nr:unnamed protein product [Allacma fusca]
MMAVQDEIQVNYLEEMEVDQDSAEVKEDSSTYYVEQETEDNDEFLYGATEHEEDLTAGIVRTASSSGITVHTRETEGGVTEVLGIEDDDVSQSGKETYETVTIVPSEGDSGEVSYVLIVQQPEDEKEEKEDDLKVYDFDEGEDPNVQTENDEEIDDPTTKRTPKKSQTATQAHMCNYCNYTSPKRYLLSRHMKSHSEERPHKCSVCERGFKTLASLQNHVNTHTGTKPHKCKYCESAFTTSGELVRHVRYRHTHEKPHHCTECDYSSVELSKLKRHMRCHTGERPYQCPHCTYASPDTFKLKRHLRIHTGEKPYECDICQARFTQSNSLKAHRLIHTGNKPVFKCELCPATCGRKTDLRIHVQKLHTSERPLKCKRCCKAFPDRYTFKLHCKTHDGEKCFKCDLCPYASSSQRHLESHMLVHTDQKPFQCELCDQAFRQKQLLRRHQNLYHNPNYVPPQPRDKQHECAECGRSFRHKGNLIRHMAIHDPESSAHERALALKLGRQKRIQIIDGQEVQVIDDDEDDEDSETQVLAVEGEDGQQYVVLEVIQLQDGDGTEQTVAVVGDDTDLSNDQILHTDTDIGDLHDPTLMQDLQDSSNGVEFPQPMVQDIKPRTAIKQEIVTENDVKNCFGFDDDDDDEGDDPDSLEFFNPIST